MAFVTIEEYEARQKEIRARLEELDSEHEGVRMSEEMRTEWETLWTERDNNDETIKELKARKAGLAALSGDPDRVEGERAFDFQTRRPGVATGDDIYDLTTIRSSFVHPEMALAE